MISRFLYVIFFVVVGILILFVGIGISVPGWDASVESPEVISPNPLKISPTIEEPTVIQEPIGAIIQGRITTPEGSSASQAEVRLLAVNWPSRLPSSGRVLSGRVFGNDTVIGEMKLKADLSTCWNPVSDTLADEDGRFLFGGVPQGTYLVCAASQESPWSTDGTLIDCDGGDDFSVNTTLSLRPELDLQFLVTKDDFPAKGVEISLFPRLDQPSLTVPELWELILNPVNSRLQTDPNGFARISQMPQYEYWVRAYSPDFGTAETTWSIWDPQVNCRESPSGEFIRTATRPKIIRLVSGVLVEGVIRDLEGYPIEAATVELQREVGLSGNLWKKNTRINIVSTDADGRYQFNQVSQGAYTIQVEKEGFARQSRDSLYSYMITDTSVDFVLTPAIVLQGIVLSDSGEPLAGARIQNVIEANNFAYSDQNGRFEIVAKEKGALVYAFKPCYTSGGWQLLTADGASEIILTKIDTLRGRVLDSNGQPIPGAVLEASGNGIKSGYMDPESSSIQDQVVLDGTMPKPLVTDEAGVFEGCPTGKSPSVKLLQIRAAGYEPLLVSLEESREGDFGDLVLRSLSYLEGTVLDPYGAPLSAARVGITSEEGWDVYALSEEDGSYRLPVPKAGQIFQAQANHPRYLPSEKVVLPVTTAGESLNLDLFLNQGAGVEFWILVDGEPAPSAYIQIGLKSKASLFGIDPSGTTDADGFYLFEGQIPPGSFRYQIECPGAGIKKGEVVLEKGVIAVVTENLKRAERLQVVVSDTTGRVPPETSVIVYDRFATAYKSKRDLDDSFLVEGYSPGFVKVMATAPGFSRVETDWIDPVGKPVNILLREATEVRFLLVDARDNQPLADASLFDFNTEEYQNVNSEGVAVVSHLPAGEHRFAAEMRNYRIQFPVVTVGTFAEEVTIYFDRGREIDVEVVDSFGNPLSGVNLKLNPGIFKDEYPWSPIYQTWISGSDGRVRISGLESGSNVLVASRDNYRSQRLDFQTGDAGEIRFVPFVLAEVATVSGRIFDRNGLKVRDARVSLQQLQDVWKEIDRKKSSYSSGQYLFSEVNPGLYRVVAESNGRKARLEFEVIGTDPVVVDLEF